jgi:hypothetical protein
LLRYDMHDRKQAQPEMGLEPTSTVTNVLLTFVLPIL